MLDGPKNRVERLYINQRIERDAFTIGPLGIFLMVLIFAGSPENYAFNNKDWGPLS